MFLQIHTLVSYPASLLNRDDAGLAKRIPFGNATRLRVSSQCLKRHWRQALRESLSDLLVDGDRTRHLFSRKIHDHLLEHGVPPEVALATSVTMKDVLMARSEGKSDSASDAEAAQEDSKQRKSKSKESPGLESLLVKQAVFFSEPEIRHLRAVALTAARSSSDAAGAERAVREALTGVPEKPKKLTPVQKLKLQDNYQAMLKAAGGGVASQSLVAGLFGRFVTSDLLARVDAPVHVAHAFTVHAASTEMDYFTVVDDLNRDDETGAAHANQAELGAGVYYGHVAVDVPLLVSNLVACERAQWKQQDRATASQVLGALVRSIASRSPGAKLGSTAPYSRAELVLLEVGAEQPRTLANAFLEALKPSGHLLQAAADRMAAQLSRIDAMYGATAAVRTLATTLEPAGFAPLSAQPLDDATREALDALWA